MLTIKNKVHSVIGHPFHLVGLSPWPLVTAFSLFGLTIGAAMTFNGFEYGNNILFFGFSLVSLVCILWWRDVIRESTFQGHHTNAVVWGLTFGFILFVISEIMFFFAWFWAFFHSSLAPAIELGSQWPPYGLETIDTWLVPLLNTVILLSSGAASTWCHASLIAGNNKGYREAIISLALTIFLGLIFSLLQGFEYYYSPFTISDGTFGSTFFVATGFHGVHIIVGTTFLIVCLFRIIHYQYTTKHHLGMESALWYWHFVDVVWLFLFVFIYWWGLS